MKARSLLPIIPLAFASLLAQDAPPAQPQIQPQAAAAVRTPEQRAEQIGFARYLPADTQAVVSVYDIKGMGKRAEGSKLWKAVGEIMSGRIAGGMDAEPMDEAPDAEDFEAPDDGKAAPEEKESETSILRSGHSMTVATDDEEPAADEEEPAAGPPGMMDIFGQEVTLAFGKPAAGCVSEINTGYERFYYFLMRAMTRSFADAVKAKDLDEISSPLKNSETGQALMKEVLGDDKSGIALLDRFNIPPIYAALRMPKENRDAIVGQIAMTLDQFGVMSEMADAVTIEKAGAKFSGQKFSGRKISEKMAEEREDMEEELGKETTDKLLEIIAKKNLVAVTGAIGEYVVVYIGGSEDDFALTDNSGQSLAASEALAFTDIAAGKDLAVLTYADEAFDKSLYGISSYCGFYLNGIRDELPAHNDAFGDTRDLQELIRNVVERERAIHQLSSDQAEGAVAFFDAGLRIESFGGHDFGAIDWKTPAKLGGLGDIPGTAIFINAVPDPAYAEKSVAFGEALFETAYAAASKIAALPLEGEDFGKFKQGFQVFNDNFRTDAITLWDAVRNDLQKGLGGESALAIDFDGSMPTVPNIPQKAVEQLKIPRITLVKPVTDRSQVSASWDKANAAATRILATISKMTQKDIPMQKPMDSQKNGFTTWYFSLPFQTNDFIPSVTLNDQWLAASTSRDRALQLLAKAGETQAAPRTGLWMRIDLDLIRKAAAEDLRVIDENAEAIFGKGTPKLKKFMKTKAFREKLMAALAEFSSVTAHARRENDVLRGSVHIKTR